MLSNRTKIISPSVTIGISTRVKELKGQGIDVTNLSIGEPDFFTPEKAKVAAIQAIKDNKTKYDTASGLLELKEAIANKLERDNHITYTVDEIVVSSGAKHAITNALLAIINPGEEVIIPKPYWTSYPEMVKLLNGVPVLAETQVENSFKLKAEELKLLITDKTKALFLTNPSNPTGAVYTKEELASIGKVLEGTDILVFSDEMYEKIMYDGKQFCAAAEVSEDMFQRTVTINGLSKAVAMTGWRFGYLATPQKNIIKAMIKLQGQVTSNVNSITQYAAICALEGEADDTIEIMRKEFEKRRNIAVEKFNSIKGISCVIPDGAFYLFVNIKDLTFDSMKFCADLLSQKGVAVVPGLAFGTEGYFRFSFATDLDSILKGIDRIEEFVNENY